LFLLKDFLATEKIEDKIPDFQGTVGTLHLTGLFQISIYPTVPGL